LEGFYGNSGKTDETAEVSTRKYTPDSKWKKKIKHWAETKIFQETVGNEEDFEHNTICGIKSLKLAQRLKIKGKSERAYRHI